METTQASQKYTFKAEISQLLDILAHSLYSSREIFLRELISNASDALDKLRFESTRGAEIRDNHLPYEIKISADKDNNILTIVDTGIGMTRREVINNIGTIAKSGSAEFVKNLAEQKDQASSIIGKFGVGFYSVFMVAEKVTIKTRSYKQGEDAVQWKSNGLGEYEISSLDEDIPRGTTIVIKLKEDAKEFTEKYTIESTIKKHSNFISFPIYFENERLNTISALWREPKSNITKEQYTEFYKYLTYDGDEPGDTIHVSVDAPIQFNALMFIPKKSHEFMMFSRDNYGLDLYVKRVLIQHKSKDLLPEYLGFVHGVVDSEDIPLNISRETLQENIVFRKISQSVTTQVYNYLIKKAKDDAEGYTAFWKEHGKFFKMGYSDYTNMEKFLELLRFNSSGVEGEQTLVSLEDYASRMKPDQKGIYFVLAPSREAAALDPHIEIFKKRGVEVLYFYDPADEFIVSSLRKFKEFEFKSVHTVDPKELDNYPVTEEEQSKKPKLSKDQKKAFEKLLKRMKEILGERVKDVIESKRLSDSPVCLINSDEQFSSAMNRVLRQMNREMATPSTPKVFEVNPDHPVVRNMIEMYKADDADPFLATLTERLYDSAALLEGDVNDVHLLVRNMNALLEQASGWYRERDTK